MGNEVEEIILNVILADLLELVILLICKLYLLFIYLFIVFVCLLTYITLTQDSNWLNYNIKAA
jgi:hypothetical protein